MIEDRQEMTDEMRIGLIVSVPLLLQLSGLLFAVGMDSSVGTVHKRILVAIQLMNVSMIVQNFGEYAVGYSGISVLLLTIVRIYSYIACPIIVVLFIYLIRKKSRFRWVSWTLVGVDAIIYLTALFSDVAFRVSANNQFYRGPLGYTCFIISLLLLIQFTYYSIKECYRVKRLETIIPPWCVLIILGSVLLDLFFPMRVISYLTIGMVSCSVLYYIWFHLQLVQKHKQALLVEQRIQIMMTQIQPHFLYNTLSTIQALCRIDPEKASDVTEKFGTYLRQNLDSLGQPNLIPIEKELEHTKLYAEIEMIRFPNIVVEYDIQDDRFLIPALIIQPLVENAIRHGVRIRDEGRVVVSTRKVADRHEIVIKDNGKGFDATEPPKTDGSHIGINNVRERVTSMCKGTMTVESKPDEGTTITIRIPVDPSKQKGVR